LELIENPQKIPSRFIKNKENHGFRPIWGLSSYSWYKTCPCQSLHTPVSLIRQGYSLIRRENVLIRREYARGRLTQIPPRPQQSHPKSYKVVPRSPKHINIGPKIQQNSNICEKLVFATPFTPNACFWSPRRSRFRPLNTHNHQKKALKSSEFQLLWKVGFCNPCHTKGLFFEPQTSRFSSQDHQKKWPGNKHAKRHLFLYKVPKKLSKWAPEIDPKSANIQVLTPRSLFLCSQVLLESQGPPGCQSGGRRLAKREEGERGRGGKGEEGERGEGGGGERGL
jgi:hypothetical protein